ncbi:MAG: acyl-CoA dehydrogenase family protein [Desulfobacteraceae bacterium]|nr:acyl-CoA dehydrogenase family protein [Desulfobacteraceae bacterium]
MDFLFTEEQQILKDSVRRLSERYFAEKAFTWEDEYPWENAKILAENGLMGVRIPIEDGGQGGTLMDAVIAIIEITKVCPHTGDVFQAGNFGAIQQIAFLGNDFLKKEVLPRLLRGETIITAAMSEPNAGSAVTDLRTTARLNGKEAVLNGSKIFNSNGDVAGYFCVWCRFGKGVESSGAVIVPETAPGFSRGKVEKYMSGEHNTTLYFDDCRVPKEYVLMSEQGFKKLMSVFNVERLGNSSRSFAVGELAYEKALQYSKERIQFNRPLCEFQGIQWKLADMKLRLEQTRWLLYKAVVDADRGLPSALNSSLAKLSCNETAEYVCREAIQIHGGYGMSREFPLAYLYQRARGWMVAGGSIEMLKNRIASEILERSFSQRPPRIKS